MWNFIVIILHLPIFLLWVSIIICFKQKCDLQKNTMKTFTQFVCVCVYPKSASHIHKYFFIVFPDKIRIDVSTESSARQRIHMKNKALLSSKDKGKQLKCRLLQFLFGALRVNNSHTNLVQTIIPDAHDHISHVRGRFYCIYCLLLAEVTWFQCDVITIKYLNI